MLARREFLGSGWALTATLVAAQSPPPTKEITLGDTIPATPFGKTGHRLPLLAFGGSAMVERWSPGYGLKALSFDQRVAMVRHGRAITARASPIVERRSTMFAAIFTSRRRWASGPMTRDSWNQAKSGAILRVRSRP